MEGDGREMERDRDTEVGETGWGEMERHRERGRQRREGTEMERWCRERRRDGGRDRRMMRQEGWRAEASHHNPWAQGSGERSGATGALQAAGQKEQAQMSEFSGNQGAPTPTPPPCPTLPTGLHSLEVPPKSHPRLTPHSQPRSHMSHPRVYAHTLSHSPDTQCPHTAFTSSMPNHSTLLLVTRIINTAQPHHQLGPREQRHSRPRHTLSSSELCQDWHTPSPMCPACAQPGVMPLTHLPAIWAHTQPKSTVPG